MTSAATADDAVPSPWRVAVGVGLAVLAVSAAAIFIRLAQAPALALAFWRNVAAAGLLLPVLVVTRSRLPRGRAWGPTLASAVALACHFGLWIASLDHTSVAASVVLVCTQPIFVTFLAWLFLKERTSPLGVVGILLAVAGTTVIGADSSFGASASFGNVLAIGGAVAVALYVLLGRSLRSTGEVGLWAYAVVVYGVAGALLGIVCLAVDVPLSGYSAETWAWIGAVALGPQILGHTLFNWALRYVKASVLSSTILIEPLISTLLAWAILVEVPGPLTLAGGVVVLTGVALVIRGR